MEKILINISSLVEDYDNDNDLDSNEPIKVKLVLGNTYYQDDNILQNKNNIKDFFMKKIFLI